MAQLDEEMAEMVENALEAALDLIRARAAEAMGYSRFARVAWVPGYEGRYAGCWEDGRWGTFSLWRLESLGMSTSHVGIDARGRWKLWGRPGSGSWRPGMTTLRKIILPPSRGLNT